MGRVELQDVTKIYRSPFGRESVVGVEHLSLSVGPGEVLALLGPNGAGKTTVVRMVVGLVTPTSGRILVGGLDVRRRRAEALSRVGAVLGESRSTYSRLTARDNLEYFAALRGMSARLARTRISHVVDLLDIQGVLSRRAGDLSRGMRQKLALAIALIPDPEILVLDEPTTGLDVAARREFRAVLRELASAGRRAVILASHDMDEVASVAHSVCVLQRGRVVATHVVAAATGRAGATGTGGLAACAGSESVGSELEELLLDVTSGRPGAGPDPGHRRA